jgi:hypothetical protein
MKRMIIISVAALAILGTVSAQAVRGRFDAPNTAPQAGTVSEETVSVEGKLAYVNGLIALQTRDKTYYVGGLQRLFGFVEGLKEGASVKVEGYTREMPLAPEYSHLMATKVSVNGKVYELPSQGMMGMMDRRAPAADKDFRGMRGDDSQDSGRGRSRR